jgi:hypothetical protein
LCLAASFLEFFNFVGKSLQGPHQAERRIRKATKTENENEARKSSEDLALFAVDIENEKLFH